VAAGVCYGSIYGAADANRARVRGRANDAQCHARCVFFFFFFYDYVGVGCTDLRLFSDSAVDLREPMASKA
jgi:hypothetical protein